LLEQKISYFEHPGASNTELTLKLAVERAQLRGIKKIVLASTSGETVRLAAREWAGNGIKIIAVPHQFGFMSPQQRFPGDLVSDLKKQGHDVHFGTMLFHTESLYGTETPKTMAELLRTICQGMKVCVEIIMMAADGGKVAVGEEIVAIAGTRRGADTAVVAVAATSTKLTDLHITEIICKPLQTKQIPPPPPVPPKAG
jgi:hypothetical protein